MPRKRETEAKIWREWGRGAPAGALSCFGAPPGPKHQHHGSHSAGFELELHEPGHYDIDVTFHEDE